MAFAPDGAQRVPRLISSRASAGDGALPVSGRSTAKRSATAATSHWGRTCIQRIEWGGLLAAPRDATQESRQDQRNSQADRAHRSHPAVVEILTMVADLRQGWNDGLGY